MNGTNVDSLLRKIAQGDNTAFETLYVRTARGVYAFLYGYLRSHTDTEDAVQTVYLKVKMGIGSYRAGTNGRAWLLQIAKNHALNELAKRKNSLPLDEIDIPVRENFDEGFTEEIRKHLTEEEYQIVTLHVLWNYKHREIAEMLCCPTGTVTSKYKRAIAKLKACLKEVE